VADNRALAGPIWLREFTLPIHTSYRQAARRWNALQHSVITSTAEFTGNPTSAPSPASRIGGGSPTSAGSPPRTRRCTVKRRYKSCARPDSECFH
jgi:hypothetical protein